MSGKLCKGNPDICTEEKAKESGRKGPRPGESGVLGFYPSSARLLVVCEASPFLLLGLSFPICEPWLVWMASQPSLHYQPELG